MEEAITVTTTPPPDLTFPAGRYGRRRARPPRGRRWVAVALAILVVVGGVAIAAKLFRQYAVSPYTAQITSITYPGERAVTVTLTVRKPAGQAAVCTVVAHTREGSPIGRAEVTVPGGGPRDTTSEVTHTLITTTRPHMATVSGCGPVPR